MPIIGGLVLLLIFLFPFLWKNYIRKTGPAGAPYVPMEPEIVDKVIKYLEIKPGDTFYDLGSGDGRLVMAAAMAGAQAYGVELDTWRVFYSRLWAFFFGLRNAHIVQDNIFNVDLSKANKLCLYLLQDTNNKIQPKLERELKAGSRVVSVAFEFPGWKISGFDPEGSQYGPIYLYQR